MTNEQLRRLRAQFIELNEAVHSMRGDPRRTWQEEAPEYAAMLAEIDAVLAAEPGEHPALPAGDVLAHQLTFKYHGDILETWWQARGGHDKCTVCAPENRAAEPASDPARCTEPGCGNMGTYPDGRCGYHTAEPPADSTPLERAFSESPTTPIVQEALRKIGEPAESAFTCGCRLLHLMSGVWAGESVIVPCAEHSPSRAAQNRTPPQ